MYICTLKNMLMIKIGQRTACAVRFAAFQLIFDVDRSRTQLSALLLYIITPRRDRVKAPGNKSDCLHWGLNLGCSVYLYTHLYMYGQAYKSFIYVIKYSTYLVSSERIEIISSFEL
jgi:hypothetical protein